MPRQFEINLAFTADTEKAKNQIQNLQSSLNQLLQPSAINKGQLGITDEIAEAQKAVRQLQVSLQKATNVDTGKLNLTKFSTELSQSGMSLESYRKQLSALGPQGEQAFIKLAESVMTADSAIKGSNKILNDLWITLKNTAKWEISSSAVKGFTGAIQTAFNYAEDLNKSLTNIQIVTGNSSEKMAEFAKQANVAAKELSTTTTEYSNAALIYYQQGLGDAETKQRTDITVQAANAAGISAEEMSDYLTAVWNSYNVPIDELEHYADVMAAVGAGTATSLEEISSAMEKVASVGDATGVSFEQLSAIVATVSSVTRQSAESIGTGYKTILARMADLELEGSVEEDGVTTTLGSVSSQLKSVGVDILDTNGDLRDMGVVLEELMGKWNGMDRATQQAIAIAIAGKRQYTQLLALMNNQDMYWDAVQMGVESDGETQRQAEVYAESWEAARDRVKAAAEGIYDSLINDDFFINLNDGIAGVLGLIEKLIDAMGGFGGVLGAIGGLGLKVFGEQISNNIQNSLKSLYSVSNVGKFQNDLLKKQAGAQVQALYNERSSGNLNAYETTDIAIGQKRLELQEQLRAKAANMSEEELELAKRALDTNQAYADRARQLAQIQADLEEQYALQKEEAANDIVDDLSVGYGLYSPEEEQERMSSLDNLINQYRDGADKLVSPVVEELDSAFRDAFKGKNLNLMDAVDLWDALDEIKGLSDEAADVVGGMMDSLNRTYSDGIQGTEEYEEAINRIRDQIKNIAKPTKDTREEFVKMAQTLGVSREDAEQLADTIPSLSQATEDARTGLDNFNRSAEEFSVATDKSKDMTAVFADGLVGITQGSMSMLQGVYSLKGAWDALNSTDMSFFDKVLSMSTSILIGMPSLISGINMFRESWDGVKNGVTAAANAMAATLGTQAAMAAASAAAAGSATAQATAEEISARITQEKTAVEGMNYKQKLLYIAASKLGITTIGQENIALSQAVKTHAADVAAKIADTAATGGLTVAQKLLAAATALANGQIGMFFALIGPILAPVLAVTGAITGLVLAFNAIKAASPEGQLKQAREELELATQAYESMTNRVEELNTTLSKLDDSYSSISKMTQGTQEWSNAIQDVNTQVLTLIDSYDILAKHPEFIQQDTSGMLSLSEEGIKNIQAENQNLVNATYSMQSAKQVEVNQKEAEVYRDSLIREFERYVTNLIPTHEQQPATGLAPASYDPAVFTEILTSAYESVGDQLFTKTYLKEFLSSNYDITEQQGEKLTELILSNSDLIESIVDLKQINNQLISSADAILESGIVNELGSILTPEDIQIFNPNAEISSYNDARKKAREDIDNEFNWQRSFNYKEGDPEWDRIQQVVKSFGPDAEYVSQNSILGFGSTMKIQNGEEEIKLSEDEFLDYAAEIEAAEHYREALQQQIIESINTLLPNDASYITSLEEQAQTTFSNIAIAIMHGIESGTSELSNEDIINRTQETFNNLQAIYESQFSDYAEGMNALQSDFSNINFADESTTERLQKNISLLNQGKISVDGFRERIQALNIEGGFEKISEDITKMAESLGIEEEELSEYTKYIMDTADSSDIFSDSLESNAEDALEVASQIMRTNKGIEALAEGFEDWSDVLKKSSKESQEYCEALGEIRAALSDILDVDVSTIDADFIQENLDLIGQAAEGSEDAIESLQNRLSQDIIANITADFTSEQAIAEINSFDQEVRDIANNLPDIEIGAIIDDAGFLEAANNLVTSSQMTADEANAYFAGIGYEPVYSTLDVPTDMDAPNVETTTQVTGFGTSSENVKTIDLGPLGSFDIELPYLQYKTTSTPLPPSTAPGDARLVSFSGNETPPEIKGFRKKAPASTNNYSSKNSGGGSPSKSSKSSSPKSSKSASEPKVRTPKQTETQKTDVDPAEKVIDLYENTDTLIQSIDKNLNKLENDKQTLWGDGYIQKLQEENALLDEQNALLEWQKQEAETYRSQGIQGLQSAGINVELNDEGFIVNREQIQAAIQQRRIDAAAQFDAETNATNAYYDSQINALPAESEQEDILEKEREAKNKAAQDAYDAASKEADNLEDFYDMVNEASEKYWEAEEQRQSNVLQQMDNNLEQITHKLEIQMEMTEFERNNMEFLRSTFREGLFGIQDNINFDNAEISNYSLDLQNINSAIDELNTQFANGEISEEQYATTLKDLTDQARDASQAIIDLSKQIGEYWVEALEDANSVMEENLDNFEHLLSLMDSFESLTKLITNEDNYSGLSEIYDDIVEISRDALTASQANYKFLAQQEAAAEQMYQDAIAKGRDQTILDQLKENWETARQLAQEGQEQMLSDAEAFGEAAQQQYENTVNQIMKEYEDAVTSGKGFDWMNAQMEHLQLKDTEYLTETNKLYQTQKLIRQANLDLENTENKAVQNRLQSFIKETEELENQTNVSAYALGIQERKYQVLLAEIALQEAQNAKDQVRLQRDTEGNFNYVYTADEDSIAEAEQNLADAQNDLYNYVREKENEIRQAELEAQQEHAQNIADIWITYANDEAARNVALAEENKRFQDEIAMYKELSNLSMEASDQAYSDSYAANLNDRYLATEESTAYQIDANERLEDANTSLQENNKVVSDVINKNYGDMQSKSNEFATEASDDLREVEGVMKTVTASTQQWADTMGSLIGSVTSHFQELAASCRTAMEVISGFQSTVDYSLLGYNAQSYAEALQHWTTRDTAIEYNIDNKGQFTENDLGGLDLVQGVDTDLSALILSSGTKEEALRWASLREAKKSDQVSGDYYDSTQSTKAFLAQRFGENSSEYQWIIDKLREKKVPGFDTGGYTGEFDGGKLALLHEKELVLNKQDTQNLLDTIDIVDRLLSTLNYQNLLAGFGINGLENNIRQDSDKLEQEVTIHAEFPNVQTHDEIEQAIYNLTNTAAQYANRKRL